jgi:hypothetical protein
MISEVLVKTILMFRGFFNFSELNREVKKKKWYFVLRLEFSHHSWAGVLASTDTNVELLKPILLARTKPCQF